MLTYREAGSRNCLQATKCLLAVKLVRNLMLKSSFSLCEIVSSRKREHFLKQNIRIRISETISYFHFTLITFQSASIMANRFSCWHWSSSLICCFGELMLRLVFR